MTNATSCPTCRNAASQDPARNNAHRAADRVGHAYHGTADFVVEEFLMDMPERWMQRVCLALCRRHALIAWREPGMRRHKFLVAVPVSYMAEVFRPALDRTITNLTQELDATTAHFITQNIEHPEPEATSVQPEEPVEPYEVEEWN